MIGVTNINLTQLNSLKVKILYTLFFWGGGGEEGGKLDKNQQTN